MAELYDAVMADETDLALIRVTVDGASFRITATEVASDGTQSSIVVPITRHKLTQLRDSITAALHIDECAHR